MSIKGDMHLEMHLLVLVCILFESFSKVTLHSQITFHYSYYSRHGDAQPLPFPYYYRRHRVAVDLSAGEGPGDRTGLPPEAPVPSQKCPGYLLIAVIPDDHLQSPSKRMALESIHSQALDYHILCRSSTKVEVGCCSQSEASFRS